MGLREERIAHNEATARDINEQIADELQDELEEATPRHSVPMVCECGHVACERVFVVALPEYATLRDDPRRFAVVPDHVIPDVEQIVAEHDQFVVVSKRDGTPADVAARRDDRT